MRGQAKMYWSGHARLPFEESDWFPARKYVISLKGRRVK